jgi:3-oxoacyl-[acyl-carrier protein] reductase
MKNRTALVTGAARGIGKAIAARLRDDGATVLAPARNELDLASNDSIDSYLSALNTPVDILICNAGINRLGRSTETTDADIAEMFQVNLVSYLRLIRGLAPQMIERGYGRITSVSSIWSVVSRDRRVVYSTTKAGLNGMTRALAVELSPHGILVNAVAPGYVNTEMTKRNNSAQEIAAIEKTLPLGRLAEPEEIAEVVWFLSSSRNSYMTGQTLVADGGFTSQ